ncbi:cyclophilin-like fold protein [uncultured Fibrobacter sp.]|uniref:cyclophilin-like fold protein n=1 Tax=uncultured Fibrobacter sp. TaxID=261512 RepID=UPI0025F4AC0F|nr:cyclophilin-like fold protein [uncultured Fibrobacter sp.]
MKKLFAFIATLLLFAACSSDAASSVKPIQPETQTPKSSASSTSKVGEAPVKLKIHVNDTTFTATLEENSSAKAFAEFLAPGDMTLDMHDYGSFEKVADLPRSFPRNDKQIDTDAGDIILYQGNSITIYYDKNSWNFTRLARIDNVNKKRLQQILGKGNVKATFSVE